MSQKLGTVLGTIFGIELNRRPGLPLSVRMTSNRVTKQTGLQNKHNMLPQIQVHDESLILWCQMECESDTLQGWAKEWSLGLEIFCLV